MSQTITLNPWNSQNKLLTEDDVYTILERGGFKNVREHIVINNLNYYQTAFIHPSYVKKHIFNDNKSITLTAKPEGILDLFEENNNYENQEFLGDRVLDMSAAFYICRKYSDRDQGFKTVLKTLHNFHSLRSAKHVSLCLPSFATPCPPNIPSSATSGRRLGILGLTCSKCWSTSTK